MGVSVLLRRLLAEFHFQIYHNGPNDQIKWNMSLFIQDCVHFIDLLRENYFLDYRKLFLDYQETNQVKLYLCASLFKKKSGTITISGLSGNLPMETIFM